MFLPVPLFQLAEHHIGVYCLVCKQNTSVLVNSDLNMKVSYFFIQLEMVLF